MKSRKKGLLRRVVRLERELGRRAIKIIPRGFAFWGAPLPPGTVVPSGARVVSDFYTNEPVKCGPDGTPTHFRPGYFCDRITTDPNDYGRDLPPLDEDTEVLLAVGCGKLVLRLDIPPEDKFALHRAYLPGYTPPPDAPRPSQAVIDEILADYHSYDIRADSADAPCKVEYPSPFQQNNDTRAGDTREEARAGDEEDSAAWKEVVKQTMNADGTLKKEYAELYNVKQKPKDDGDKEGGSE